MYCDTQLEALLTSTKDTIGLLAAKGLHFYDISYPTTVLTDYSLQDIEFVIL